jgi:hypothetical protein
MGSTYVDRPWDLNGYAITLEGCTVLVDSPSPGEDGWSSFDLAGIKNALHSPHGFGIWRLNPLITRFIPLRSFRLVGGGEARQYCLR